MKKGTLWLKQFLTLICLFAAMPLIGCSPTATGYARLRPEMTSATVAVPHFQGVRDGDVAADLFALHLGRVTNFSMVERTRIEKLLQELKFGLTGLVDPQKAKTLGRMVGADYVVVGRIDINHWRDLDIVDYSRVIISVKFINVETGVTEAHVSVNNLSSVLEGHEYSQIEACAKALAEKIVTK